MNTVRRVVSFVLPLALLLVGCAPQAMPTSLPSIAAATQAPMATQAPANEPVAGVGQAPSANQLIIKDATLVLTVRDVEQVMGLVTTLAADNGGYLIRTETWVDDEAKFASLHLAVPSPRFEAMLSHLRRLAVKVEHETASGQDVTAEYTDLRSQLVNLEATAARVRAFLDDAQTVEDSLRINAELSRLEGDIERITGQMHYYEGRAAYSTINLSLQPEAAVPPALPGWNPLETLENALQVARTLSQSAVDLGIWITVIFGPLALVAGLLFAVLRLMLRRRALKRA